MKASNDLYYFIADTCILVVVAYLMARGRTLTLLFRESLTAAEVLLLGLVMGLIGLAEAIFPDVGLPYATHTLFVIFAAIVGGLRVGLVSAAVVTLGSSFFQAHELVLPTMLAVLISAFLGKLVRRARTNSRASARRDGRRRAGTSLPAGSPHAPHGRMVDASCPLGDVDQRSGQRLRHRASPAGRERRPDARRGPARPGAGVPGA